MRPITDLRRRGGARGEWLRLGLLSASVVAPLVARWNDLRAAERAATMRDEIEARVKALGELAPWTKQDSRQHAASSVRKARRTLAANRDNGVTRLWLIGAGVGLAAAGVAAYLLARRRLGATAEEPYLDLPADGGNGARSNGLAAAKARPAMAPTTAAATASVGETLQQAEHADEEHQQPGEEPIIVEPTPWDGGGATVTPSGAPAGVVDPSEAPFVGNIHTMIYHEANAENLPEEENRIYFASEEEARDAGYRRDKDEVPAGEGKAQS